MDTNFIRENKPIDVSPSSQAWLTDKLNQVLDEYDALKASHEKLVKYAQHKQDCSKLCHMKGVTFPSIALDCDCGFEQALAEAEELK